MTEPIWDELRTEMQKFFNEFDHNRRGKLGVEEITAILKSVGLRCSAPEVREMMMSVTDATPLEIGIDELMQILMDNTNQCDEEQTMRNAFDKIDVDGDGRISVEDVQIFMESIGEMLDRKYAETLIKYANSDESLEPLTFEQYKKVLNNQWK